MSIQKRYEKYLLPGNYREIEVEPQLAIFHISHYSVHPMLWAVAKLLKQKQLFEYSLRRSWIQSPVSIATSYNLPSSLHFVLFNLFHNTQLFLKFPMIAIWQDNRKAFNYKISFSVLWFRLIIHRIYKSGIISNYFTFFQSFFKMHTLYKLYMYVDLSLQVFFNKSCVELAATDDKINSVQLNSIQFNSLFSNRTWIMSHVCKKKHHRKNVKEM